MDSPLRAIVTCGPGIAPVDSVRRITNFSTGELGVRLSESLLERGWSVSCFKSSASTYRDPVGHGLNLRSFATNGDLLAGLYAEPDPESVSVIFHAAALSDYEVASITDAEGNPVQGLKICGSLSELRLTLQPASKLLPQLRGLFPKARIVGWKFELDGGRASALERGQRQLRENQTALCVVNGAAYGSGFGILDPQGSCAEVQTRSDLCVWLTRWASSLVL